jgi:hypothetical protein
MGRYLAELRQLEAKEKNTENTVGVTLINQKNLERSSNLGLLGTAPAIFPEKKISLPTIPAICRMLQIDWPEVDRQVLLDDEDLLLYAMGKYPVKQIALYLVSWQLDNQSVPFPLVRDDVVLKYIYNLPADNQKKLSEWLPINIRHTAGD